MLTPALRLLSRLVGRLRVGRKLLLIYLLDLTAVIYISGILINEKYIAIDFARKELAGAAYMAAARDALLAAEPALQPAGADPVAQEQRIRAAAQAVREAERHHGDGMQAAEPSEAFARALEGHAAAPGAPQPWHAAIAAGRDLVTRIGNQSNLILDPDLDSYYTMSLLLLRFPELLELLDHAAQKAERLRAARPADAQLRQKLRTELLILEGRLDAIVRGTASDYQEAFSAGTPALRAALDDGRGRLLGALAAFRSAGLDADGGGVKAPDGALHRAALERLGAAWVQADAELARLLETRVDGLMSRMWLHLGTALGLLLVILGLVYFVAQQIVKPLGHLAGVAERISRTGDYAQRARLRGDDETTQLARAFNDMLAELDRSRGAREELAAAARAADAQRALVEAFPTALIVTSIPDHAVLHANEPARAWIGDGAADPWQHGLEPAARGRFFQRLADIGHVDEFEVRWKPGAAAGAGGARPQWALLSARRLEFLGRDALVTAFTPIGRLKQLEERLQLLAKVFEASSESIMILDAEQRLLTANAAFVRATGWDLADSVGQVPGFLASDRHDSAFFETARQATIIRGSWQGELWLRRKNGEAYPNWVVMNAVRTPEGHLANFVFACVDISEHKASEARIHHLAHHDVLTDLPNRALCMERLRMAVEQASRGGRHVGVVFIDLDRFKTINDSLGHHVGDELLCSVAQRLDSAVRDGDTVSRLGGDEFVIVLADVADVGEIARVIDERLLPLVRRPHRVGGAELTVSCSAGVAVYPQDGRDIDHLMRNADAAMYQAKARGRNQALFFAAEFHERAQERLAIETALPHAAARGELRLHYQPRVDARSGALRGVEALVRWQHPEQGTVSPARFIPIAEETGDIHAIGLWTVDEACRQQARWREDGTGEVAVSINISALQLRDGRLAEAIEAALKKHGVAPEMIELELTESSLMDHALATVAALKRLKAIGVQLSIDDFGTGYSSLNYLHQFPIDKLKIDQSFVRDMLDDPADLAITRAIIGLGHTLGLQVVAEGVERDGEEKLLRDAGCDELQGYLYAKPMQPDVLAGWLGKRVVEAGKTAAVAA